MITYKLRDTPITVIFCTENKNNTNCGNCDDSKLTIKPLLITQREIFITLKSIKSEI